MERKYINADFILKNRVITIPINESIQKNVVNNERSVIADSHSLTRYLLRFLSNQKQTVYLNINGIDIEFEIPCWLADSLELEVEQTSSITEDSEELNQLLRMMLPAATRPPTQRQLEYANAIAKLLNISMSEEQLSKTDECGYFIDEHLAEFRERQSYLKIIQTLSRKAARGYAALVLMQKNKDNTGYVLNAMKVSRQETLLKYIAGLREFLNEFPQFEPEDKIYSISVVNDFLIDNFEDDQFAQFDYATGINIVNDL